MFRSILTTLIFSALLIEIAPDAISIDVDINYLKYLTEMLNKLPKDDCVSQFLTLADSLSEGEEWAMRMLDASAKPQSGILMGNTIHVGNYDECLEIRTNVRKTQILGKYCTAFLSPHPEFGKNLDGLFGDLMGDFGKKENEANIVERARLSYGLCVPKICTTKVLQNISNVLEDLAEFPLHFTFVDDFCDGGDPRPYTISAIVAILIFSMFAAIVVSSTLYDIFFHTKLTHADKQPNLLTSFSVLTNGKKLFATNASKEDLGCLNGLRVISMMWIVFVHVLQHAFFLPHINAVHMLEKWKIAKENAIFLAGGMAVDTFFVIGGLLVTYLFMKSQAKGAKFSLPMFYIHRILRLTPALAMTILLTSTLLVYTGNGPFWPAVHSMYQKQCEDNWWATLTYLQNYLIPSGDQCVGHAWYLAVDTQMYFLSPLVLFPLLKWPKRTISVVSVLVFSNCAYVFGVTWIKRLGTTFFDFDTNMYDYIYFTTHVRGTVYIIGMICGYFVYITRTTRPLKLTKFQVMVSWASSLAAMTGICFAFSAMASAEEYNVVNAAFFNSFIRVGWSAALSVIIVLCVNGYGGPINSFLSHKIFTVLIRLNYSIYLLHMDSMMITMGQERTSTYFYNLFYFRQFWGDYMFVVGSAVIWTLAFESPIIAIEKIVFAKKKEVKSSKSENAENGDLKNQNTGDKGAVV